MFLRRSDKTQDAVANAEKNKKIEKRKENELEKLRVKEVAANVNKKAEIGAE